MLSEAEAVIVTLEERFTKELFAGNVIETFGAIVSGVGVGVGVAVGIGVIFEASNPERPFGDPSPVGPSYPAPAAHIIVPPQFPFEPFITSLKFVKL